MSKLNNVKSWKNIEFKQNLTAEEQASLVANPAGSIELSDDEMRATHGGQGITAPVNAPRSFTDCCHVF